MAKILVVEDESLIAETIVHSLRFSHYETAVAIDGEAGLELLLTNSFDVAIVDWNLPKMSGPDVCRRYSATNGNTLILMLTANASIDDKIQGLDSGADDYLTKPFDLKELHSRILALLRRSGPRLGESTLTAGKITMEPANFRVSKAGVEVNLVKKEFAILELLIRNRGRVFSPEEIISSAWTTEEQPNANVIKSHIRNIRKKFDDDEVIETVHGLGYRVQKA